MEKILNINAAGCGESRPGLSIRVMKLVSFFL